MARYKKIDVKMWNDTRFRSLSRPQPNAQSLWQFLLTGHVTTTMPGLFSTTRGTLADTFDWSVDDTMKCFAELSLLQMVTADWDARVIWIPRAYKYNEPESLNVVKSWEDVLHETPDCKLKWAACMVLLAELEVKGPGFLRTFEDLMAKDLGPKFRSVLIDQARGAPPAAFRLTSGKPWWPEDLRGPDPEPKSVESLQDVSLSGSHSLSLTPSLDGSHNGSLTGSHDVSLPSSPAEGISEGKTDDITEGKREGKTVGKSYAVAVAVAVAFKEKANLVPTPHQVGISLKNDTATPPLESRQALGNTVLLHPNPVLDPLIAPPGGTPAQIAKSKGGKNGARRAWRKDWWPYIFLACKLLRAREPAKSPWMTLQRLGILRAAYDEFSPAMALALLDLHLDPKKPWAAFARGKEGDYNLAGWRTSMTLNKLERDFYINERTEKFEKKIAQGEDKCREGLPADIKETIIRLGKHLPPVGLKPPKGDHRAN